jgi:hypothetical protein
MKAPGRACELLQLSHLCCGPESKAPRCWLLLNPIHIYRHQAAACTKILSMCAGLGRQERSFWRCCAACALCTHVLTLRSSDHSDGCALKTRGGDIGYCVCTGAGPHHGQVHGEFAVPGIPAVRMNRSAIYLPGGNGCLYHLQLMDLACPYSEQKLWEDNQEELALIESLVWTAAGMSTSRTATAAKRHCGAPVCLRPAETMCPPSSFCSHRTRANPSSKPRRWMCPGASTTCGARVLRDVPSPLNCSEAAHFIRSCMGSNSWGSLIIAGTSR